jgi:uncharacterized membrane protein (UPF0127 family)
VVWPDHSLAGHQGLFLAPLLLLLLLAGACVNTMSAPLTPPRPALEPSVDGQGTVVVRAGEGTFFALVADTAALRAQGLAGREALPKGWGMWFDLGSRGQTKFWMKEMRFPIDIIWVDETFEVVHVTHKAMTPLVWASDAELPRYDSGGKPVRYVLEIGAGQADELGIGPGTYVGVEKLQANP